MSIATQERSITMGRFIALGGAFAVIAATAAVIVGTAGGAGNRTLEQAQAAGWDCNPLILIGGHYHCSPPGQPSVGDIIAGTADTASIVHQVFATDGRLAGTELLIRADLFAGQGCPTDEWLPVPPWLPVPQYYACHHFDFTP
jgi:hypothetical protein